MKTINCSKFVRFTVIFSGMLVFASVVGAQTPVDSEALQILRTDLNALWVLAAAAMVFLMQAGFMCLEAGMAAAKHSINVAIKNMADFVIAVAAFWAVGFGLMFGASENGIIGTSDFFIPVDDPWRAAFFIFQSVFVGTAATIDSGAIAGRTKFGAYLFLSALVSLLIYPVFGHWAWGSLLHGEQQGWLETIGFIDFAGSTVVHSLGGWVALAGVIVIGPRIGKYDEDGKPRRLQPHNLTLTYLGTFILFFGWFGFNGGSTLEAGPAVAPIIMNTILAGCLGCISCSALSWMFSPFRRPEGEMICNGVLGGLVAITAGCASVGTAGAATIGLIAGFVVFFGSHFIEKILKLDDVVGAIAVHGLAGAWGTIAVGIFITESNLGETSRLSQIGVQTLGVFTCFFWTFLSAYLIMRLINWITPLRVPPEDEQVGLNISEHGAASTILDLANAMHKATSTGDFSKDLMVEVEYGTEAGDLAQGFNQMLDAIHEAFREIQKQREMSSSNRERYFKVVEGHIGRLYQKAQEIAEATYRSALKSEEISQLIYEIANASQKISESMVTISQNTNHAAAMSQEAYEKATDSKTVVDQFGRSAEEIGKFVDMINNIALQSRMVALNASVEAARAGQVGKGFAVVAEEIQVLAQQSKEATDYIAAKTEEIQQGTQAITRTIDTISVRLEDINQVNNTIATTVEQNTSITATVSNNVADAAKNAKEVSDEVGKVAKEAGDITQELKAAYYSIKRVFQDD